MKSLYIDRYEKKLLKRVKNDIKNFIINILIRIMLTIFKQKDLGKREWGKEILIGLVSKKFSLKKLFIKAGNKGGLQYHRKKDECGFLISGKLLIRYDNGKGRLVEKVLQKGDCFHFPPSFVHQEEAITDCEIFEVSTPHFNDRVRVEKKYGLKEDGGLETTKKSEIIEK